MTLLAILLSGEFRGHGKLHGELHPGRCNLHPNEDEKARKFNRAEDEPVASRT